MKRSRLSYDEWKCITEKSLSGKHVHTDFLEGYVGLLHIHNVTEKQIWKFNGEDITVCSNGFKWLSILPQNDFYCITAMINEKDEILVWYIDMIADQGLADDGIPYFDDLYLDLVVYPNGDIFEDDMDELKEALRTNDITQRQYELAIATSQRLKTGLLSDIQCFKEYTRKCFHLLVNEKEIRNASSN